MFCPNCGAQNPDNATFCSGCGNPICRPQQSAAPVQPAAPVPPVQPAEPVQPVMPAAPVQPAAPVRPPMPVNKKQFLASAATASTKAKHKLVLVTMLVALALIAGSIFSVLFTSMFDIPAVSTILSLAGDDADVDELTDSLDEAVEEMEHSLEMMEDAYDDDEIEAAEGLIKAAENLSDSFSIRNLRALVSVVERTADDYGDAMDEMDMDSLTDDLENVSLVINALIGFIIGTFFLPVLFTVLGGCLRSTGLTVTAIVFTVLTQLVLCGLLWVVLSLAAGIFQAVLCSQVNKAYKNYRFSLVAGR